MPRPKTYPRHTTKEGEEMLLLLDADVLGELDTDWINDRFAVETAVRLFNEYSDAAATWFYIQTGIRLYTEKTETGVVWCVEDTKPLSQNYRWLVGKAKRAVQKIVERINQDGETVTEELRRAGATGG